MLEKLHRFWTMLMNNGSFWCVSDFCKCGALTLTDFYTPFYLWGDEPLHWCLINLVLLMNLMLEKLISLLDLEGRCFLIFSAGFLSLCILFFTCFVPKKKKKKLDCITLLGFSGRRGCGGWGSEKGKPNKAAVTLSELSCQNEQKESKKGVVGRGDWWF